LNIREPFTIRLRQGYGGTSVMSRANGKGNIFETDVDRLDFVKTLAEACEKTGFEIHAYCLMRNHFHLVVETPNGNLVAGMRWLLSQGMEARRAAESDPAEWQAIRRGWCLGPAQFKTDLLERMAGKLGEYHAGELKRESAVAKAERIIQQELKRLRWSPGEMSKRPKSDPAKLAIAARLRRETTLTLPWIAARLQAGTWKSLNAKLYRPPSPRLRWDRLEENE